MNSNKKIFRAESWLAILIGIIGLFASGCSKDSGNESGKSFSSPSGNYKVAVSVNKDKVDKTKYLCLKLHLHDSDGKEIDTVQTGASDTMKWALGWMKDKDSIVLYSSDIGTYGYQITTDDKLERIESDDASIIDRGRELYEKKYRKSN